MMKRRLFFVFFLVVLQLQVFSQSFSIPDDVERIVFLGNSITYGGKYIEYIDAYMTINHPEKGYEFINVGLPSETVSGLSEENHAGGRFPRPDLHERLERVLSQTKPDLVLACYGMNDGIYKPFDDARFEKYKAGINWLDAEAKKAGVEIIHITPPIYDERRGAAYANVLDVYASWLVSNRYTADWDVIDIHWPMQKSLEQQRAQDSTFVFARDGVHPNDLGHFLMAKQILLYLGESQISNSNDIKAALGGYQNGEKILSLVEQRQQMMKHAWLTATGHLRPGVKVGLPMEEAQSELEVMSAEIRTLLKQK